MFLRQTKPTVDKIKFFFNVVHFPLYSSVGQIFCKPDPVFSLAGNPYVRCGIKETDTINNYLSKHLSLLDLSNLI